MGRIERISWINHELQRGRSITARTIAERFEVAEKTAKRDIEYLRDRCEAPVVWNSTMHTYELEAAWRGLDFLDEHSLLAVAFINRLLKNPAI